MHEEEAWPVRKITGQGYKLTCLVPKVLDINRMSWINVGHKRATMSPIDMRLSLNLASNLVTCPNTWVKLSRLPCIVA
jgi:hypothetical protein